MESSGISRSGRWLSKSAIQSDKVRILAGPDTVSVAPLYNQGISCRDLQKRRRQRQKEVTASSLCEISHMQKNVQMVAWRGQMYLVSYFPTL